MGYYANQASVAGAESPADGHGSNGRAMRRRYGGRRHERRSGPPAAEAFARALSPFETAGDDRRLYWNLHRELTETYHPATSPARAAVAMLARQYVQLVRVMRRIDVLQQPDAPEQRPPQPRAKTPPVQEMQWLERALRCCEVGEAMDFNAGEAARLVELVSASPAADTPSDPPAEDDAEAWDEAADDELRELEELAALFDGDDTDADISEEDDLLALFCGERGWREGEADWLAEALRAARQRLRQMVVDREPSAEPVAQRPRGADALHELMLLQDYCSGIERLIDRLCARLEGG